MRTLKSFLYLLCIVINCPLIAQINSQQNLNFYPLQNGNVWFYTWTYQNGSDSSFALEDILHDTTLVNGQKYFIRRIQEYKNRKRTIPVRTYNKFQRVDETSGLVFQFDINEPYPSERIIFNLFSDEGDTTILDSHGFRMICTKIENRVVFNNTRTVKSFSFPNTKSFSFIADGIGEISYVTGI